MKLRSQPTRVARALAAVTGIQKYLIVLPTLVLAGVAYTPAQIISMLTGYVTTVTALRLLHAQLHAAVVAAEAQAAQIDELLTALEVYVVGAYGPTSDKLTEYGYSPRKVAALSVAEKAAAHAKATTTRERKAAALAAVEAPPPPPATPAVTNGVAKA